MSDLRPARGLLGRVGTNSPRVANASQDLDVVIEHLRVLLNTRQGESPSCLDYGVIDLCDLIHNFPAGIQHLRRSIRETIEKYEPRLTGVNVTTLPSADPLSLRFEITARMAGSGSGFRLDTQVLPSGRVKVR